MEEVPRYIETVPDYMRPKPLPKVTAYSRESELCPRRLIHTPSLKVVTFNETDSIPPYAVLSHVHDKDGEVSFQEFLDVQINPGSKTQIEQRSGYQKIQKACSTAQQLGLDYLWIDTCCIDQRDPVDVSRNIGSMFAYYRNSAVCLVYLSDYYIFKPVRFTDSQWFKRGWTLPELVVPREALFFDDSWRFMDSRQTLASELAYETKINKSIFEGTLSVKDVIVEERLKWCQGRKTTRPHDMACCLMGIFEVELEVDYGEPVEKTFSRFQEEFVRTHPNVRTELVLEHLTWRYFLATGFPVPPTSWPTRESEICPRRLIHTPSLRLIDFAETDVIPHYAIVSHRWLDGEEISYAEFREVQNNRDASIKTETKSGYQKIQKACSVALQFGLEYLWIDTCCIDQRENREVSRDINAMYAYYRNSALCLVYLHDAEKEFSSSEWFKRGWTLQELVAPSEVLFFERNWTFIGSRQQLKGRIAKLTGIDKNVLDGTVSFKSIDLMEKLRLIQKRRTTKLADLAYCMLGILGVKLEVEDEPVDSTFKRLDDALCQAYPDVPMGAFTSVASMIDADFKLPEAGEEEETDKIDETDEEETDETDETDEEEADETGEEGIEIDHSDSDSEEVFGLKSDYSTSQIPEHPRRFIDTRSLRLVDVKDDDEISYAILSHRWIEGQEVSYQDLDDPSDSQLKTKGGYIKIQKACFTARFYGYDYLWVDTCCIDQTDPEDVARNIGSMYAYYQNAAICVVYLHDMGPLLKSIAYSEWFTRGWTLQELVAPRRRLFFDQEWKYKGTKIDLKSMIGWVTGIQEEVLEGEMDITSVRVRDRIGWVRGRKTTKAQDLAYCLLGILGVQLTANYQEPVEKTFQLLKEEIGRVHPEVGELPEDFFMFLAGVSSTVPQASERSSAQIETSLPTLATYLVMFWLGAFLGMIVGSYSKYDKASWRRSEKGPRL
ncbi:hypothetical protein VKT23_013582 [Stygiomarasmius scandens]|uniref:Heterokaryon incompatibility domain-containing protein n=1 Tax=Marasmiellus scandens TaxID=2682957 RepID=A0ABR1J2W6_9AGAR